jgi:hypothetical protein
VDEGRSARARQRRARRRCGEDFKGCTVSDRGQTELILGVALFGIGTIFGYWFAMIVVGV